MIPLDYYGRLLRRAKARANASLTALDDPFNLTAPWLDERPHDPDAPARDAIVIDRPPSPSPPPGPSAPLVARGPTAPPPVAITPPAPRIGNVPPALVDPPLPPSLTTPSLTTVTSSPEAVAGEEGAGRTTPPAMLVPQPSFARADEVRTAPVQPVTRDADRRASELVLAPLAPPDRSTPPVRPSDETFGPERAASAPATGETGPATRLVPTIPRVAAVPSAPLGPAAPGGTITPTVTIDHLDIEIASAPPPRRSPQEAATGRRPDASAAADSGPPSRELWRGPTDQAFGLGQV